MPPRVNDPRITLSPWSLGGVHQRAQSGRGLDCVPLLVTRSFISLLASTRTSTTKAGGADTQSRFPAQPHSGRSLPRSCGRLSQLRCYAPYHPRFQGGVELDRATIVRIVQPELASLAWRIHHAPTQVTRRKKYRGRLPTNRLLSWTSPKLASSTALCTLVPWK